MIFPITLSYDYPGLWFVTTVDYDAEWTGDSWRGSHIESAKTPDKALQEYKEWLWLENGGEETIELEIIGPSIELEHKKFYVK